MSITDSGICDLCDCISSRNSEVDRLTLMNKYHANYERDFGNQARDQRRWLADL